MNAKKKGQKEVWRTGRVTVEVLRGRGLLALDRAYLERAAAKGDLKRCLEERGSSRAREDACTTGDGYCECFVTVTKLGCVSGYYTHPEIQQTRATSIARQTHSIRPQNVCIRRLAITSDISPSSSPS